MYFIALGLTLFIGGIVLFSPSGRFFPIFGFGIYLFSACLLSIFFNPKSLFFMWSDINVRHKYWMQLWIYLNKAIAYYFSVRFAYFFWLIYFFVFLLISAFGLFGIFK